jgi:hypothetical protein
VSFADSFILSSELLPSMKTLLLIIAIATIPVFAGCSSPATTPPAQTNNAAPSGQTQAAADTVDADQAAVAKPTLNPEKPTDGVRAFGVAECDEFMERAEKCIGNKNTPEAAKSALKQAAMANREAWQAARNNPATKGSLAKMCRAALEETQATFDLCK